MHTTDVVLYNILNKTYTDILCFVVNPNPKNSFD